MPARPKLGAAAPNEARAVAAPIGLIGGSRTIFGVAAAVLFVGAFVSGDLRPTPRCRPK